MTMTTQLSIPDEAELRRELALIDKFQCLVRANLKEGLDYGIIPGTGKKPTLLKPGAEKTTKLLSLSDTYSVQHRIENWTQPFFSYEVKCTLTRMGTDQVISEGLGSCNSWESKYRYRWVWPDDVPPDMDKTKLVKRVGRKKMGNGTFTQYRMDNEYIFDQVNTLLKMAEKRALVDAALHAGRLSELFTQDVEDGAVIDTETYAVETPKPEVAKPQVAKRLPPPKPEPSPDATESTPQPVADKPLADSPSVDIDWLNESLAKLRKENPKVWNDENILSFIQRTYAGAESASSVTEALSQMEAGQKKHFVNRVQESLRKLAEGEIL
tara:strand:- start:1605 stop:2579 length:975 start_codon:yes stop_codon:yes gene_type:complete